MEADIEKLIAAIKGRPVLYNHNIKDYHNKDVVEEKWEDVSYELGVSSAECRSKWHSLRSGYARHLRDAKRHAPSGSAFKKKKKWYLADALSFLDDFIGQHRKMKSHLRSDDVCDETEVDCSQVTADVKIEITDDMVTINTRKPAEIPETATQQRNVTPLPPTRMDDKKIQSAPTNPADMMAAPLIEFLKARSPQVPQVEENKTLTFFKSLVPDVDKLSERRKRKFKEEVMRTLNNYLDEQENEIYQPQCVYSPPLSSPSPVPVYSYPSNMQLSNSEFANNLSSSVVSTDSSTSGVTDRSSLY